MEGNDVANVVDSGMLSPRVLNPCLSPGFIDMIVQFTDMKIHSFRSLNSKKDNSSLSSSLRPETSRLQPL